MHPIMAMRSVTVFLFNSRLKTARNSVSLSIYILSIKVPQQKVKELIRDASGNIVDWSDQEIQKQVQTVTNPWSRMQSFIWSLMMIFGPLYFIYGVLPILG